MSDPTGARWSFEAIGTSWRIDTQSPLDRAARQAVHDRIERFDREWSRFRADSVVSALAGGARSVPIPADAVHMLDLYAELDQATGGAVNPLIGDVLARRGYGLGYHLVDAGPERAAAWRDVVVWSGETLEVRTPSMIDVGAVGKGRLVDVVLGQLAPVVDGVIVVDASGDLALRGRERIALEHPFDARRAIGVWEVHDGALCASATNRRAWGDGLHHVLDARTGEPVRTVAATWAVAADAMTADAAATALFFEGGPRFAHDHDAAWVRMTTDGRVEWSPDCKAELFT